MSAKIISIANNKGGIGKTTTTRELGGLTAQMGQRTLLIDCDPQNNLGSAFGLRDVSKGSFDWFVQSEHLEFNDVVVRGVGQVVNLDIVPARGAMTIDGFSSEVLKYNEVVYGDEYQRSPLRVIAECVQQVKDEYDWIFIDCPPTISKLMQSALVASTHLLIPVECDPYNLDATTQMFNQVTKLNKINADLHVLGVFAVKYESRAMLSGWMQHNLNQIDANALFTASIRKGCDLSKTILCGQPLCLTEPKHPVVEDYQSLLAEIQERILTSNSRLVAA
jgi:chromosome partitioning protein